MTPTQDLIITIGALAGCIGLFAYGRSVAARPANPAKPRMVPWNAVLIGLGFVVLILLVHLVNLLGFRTGQH